MSVLVLLLISTLRCTSETTIREATIREFDNINVIMVMLTMVMMTMLTMAMVMMMRVAVAVMMVMFVPPL